MLKPLLLGGVLPIFLSQRCDAYHFPNQTFKSEPFQVPKLKILKSVDPNPGYLVFSMTGQGGIPDSPLIMDNSGDMIWCGAPKGVNYPARNLNVQNYKGKDVLTYWKGYGDHFGHGYGNIILLDNTYNVIRNVCLPGNFVTPLPNAFPGERTNPCYFDGHEAYLTDRGTVLGTAFNVTRADLTAYNGPEDGWIFDAQFYEVDVKTNKILFKWSSIEHVPLEKSNYFGDNKTHPLHIGLNTYGFGRNLPWDYFHINSVQSVPGGYIANSRMTFAFYFINGTTGDIEWTLEGTKGGDFKLLNGVHYTWQHMPRLLSTDGDVMKISLFDNENINNLVHGKVPSAGLLLDVDTRKKTATLLRDLKDDAHPVFATAEGSYQALSRHHVFLGYGSKAIMKEFDVKGDVTLHVQFAPLTNKNPDQDQGKDVHSYRAYKHKWEGNPTGPPKAAAFFGTPKTNIHVFMSWNGATNYNGWNIYAGPKRDNMKKIKSGVEKSGFETSHILRTDTTKGHKYIMVEALSSGSPMRNSTIIKVQPTPSDLI